jgi:hypothetical protein
MYKCKYDFMAHHIAPFGTKVLVYVSPEERKSWADHGVPGYYVGPAANTYRTFRIYIPKTRGFRDAETVAWFPEEVRMPGATAHDTLLAAIEKLNLNITSTVPHDIQQDYRQLSQLLRDSIELYHGPVSAAHPAPTEREFNDENIVPPTGVVTVPSPPSVLLWMGLRRISVQPHFFNVSFLLLPFCRCRYLLRTSWCLLRCKIHQPR